ncbi:MAG: ROK family protein [Acidimicrobiales bacterium]
MVVRLGAVEAGGTKFRAAVTDGDASILAEVRIPTTSPAETMRGVEEFFAAHDPVQALGIASFGPLVVDPSSPDYGSIASTPKPHWSGAPLLSRLRDSLDVPTEILTDVEAAAVAECEVGRGEGRTSVAYVTVGTGVGAAVAIDGVAFRGRDHTELGHIPVRRIPGDSFQGICPFHRDCLEGMASGTALAARWDADPSTLDDRTEVWELEAAYLAQLVRVFAYSFAPDIVLFGGGVGTRPDLMARIQRAVATDLGGYSVSHTGNADLVATAGLGADAGLIGAAMVARSLVH